MAKLIKADGTEMEVKPVGSKWTLIELRAYVGGDIEMMPGVSFKMFMDEEGGLKRLPLNQKATKLVLESLKGKVLRYTPRIVGDVLLLDPGEKV